MNPIKVMISIHTSEQSNFHDNDSAVFALAGKICDEPSASNFSQSCINKRQQVYKGRAGDTVRRNAKREQYEQKSTKPCHWCRWGNHLWQNILLKKGFTFCQAIYVLTMSKHTSTHSESTVLSFYHVMMQLSRVASWHGNFIYLYTHLKFPHKMQHEKQEEESDDDYDCRIIPNSHQRPTVCYTELLLYITYN